MKTRLYRTAETFEGENLRKLMKNTIFVEKLSRIARFGCAKDATLPNFAEKTFVNSHKTAKFAKVSRLPRLKFCIYMLFARVPER